VGTWETRETCDKKKKRQWETEKDNEQKKETMGDIGRQKSSRQWETMGDIRDIRHKRTMGDKTGRHLIFHLQKETRVKVFFTKRRHGLISFCKKGDIGSTG
jgi:glutamine synthetase adenylyltransferase